MQLKALIGFISQGFAKERACAMQTKKEIENLRSAIASMEKKLGENNAEVQSALDALESQIDYSPVVDTIANEMVADSDVETSSMPTEGLNEASIVTPAEVAEAVIETITTEIVKEEDVELAPNDVSELKEMATETVEATV